MAKEHVVFAVLVGQRFQPSHILRLEDLRMLVEDVASSVVVVGIVHAARHRSVVVAQHGKPRRRAHEVAGFVGAGAIPDRVAQADELVDGFGCEGLEHRLKCLNVRVGVRENAVTHWSCTIASRFHTRREQLSSC